MLKSVFLNETTVGTTAMLFVSAKTVTTTPTYLAYFGNRWTLHESKMRFSQVICKRIFSIAKNLADPRGGVDATQ